MDWVKWLVVCLVKGFCTSSARLPGICVGDGLAGEGMPELV